MKERELILSAWKCDVCHIYMNSQDDVEMHWELTAHALYSRCLMIAPDFPTIPAEALEVEPTDRRTP